MEATKKSILIIDDDEVFHLINEKLLSKAGLASKIHSVRSSQEALQIFNQYFARITDIPDVILLDLNMPGMDGFEFIKAFRCLNFPHKEKIVIIILTSSNTESDMKKAESLGIKYFITKPMKIENLKVIIENEFR